MQSREMIRAVYCADIKYLTNVTNGSLAEIITELLSIDELSENVVLQQRVFNSMSTVNHLNTRAD